MTPPEYEDAYARATDLTPFSTGTEGEGWMGAWCHRCVHDRDAREFTGPGCPLVLVALGRRTPAEWMCGPTDDNGAYSITGQYLCSCYQSEEEGS